MYEYKIFRILCFSLFLNFLYLYNHQTKSIVRSLQVLPRNKSHLDSWLKDLAGSTSLTYLAKRVAYLYALFLL